MRSEESRIEDGEWKRRYESTEKTGIFTTEGTERNVGRHCPQHRDFEVAQDPV